MHLAMAFGSYMPSHGFWLKSFDETMQDRIDEQWYGITPWSSIGDEEYGYGDGDGSARRVSRVASHFSESKHGRRHGSHRRRKTASHFSRSAAAAHAKTLAWDARRADVPGSGLGSGSGSQALGSSSGSDSGSGSGSGSGSAGYECSYDNYCSYSNGDGGGYGRKHGWAFAFNLTETDVHFFRNVLPTLRWVVRTMSWINLITCGMRFFAFLWAELPLIVWQMLEAEDSERRNAMELDAAAGEKEEESQVLNDDDIIWVAECKASKSPSLENNEQAEVPHVDRWVQRRRQLLAALSSPTFYYETAFFLFPLIAVILDEPLYSAYSLLEMCFWESSRPVTDAVLKNLG